MVFSFGSLACIRISHSHSLGLWIYLVDICHPQIMCLDLCALRHLSYVELSSQRSQNCITSHNHNIVIKHDWIVSLSHEWFLAIYLRYFKVQFTVVLLHIIYICVRPTNWKEWMWYRGQSRRPGHQRLTRDVPRPAVQSIPSGICEPVAGVQGAHVDTLLPQVLQMMQRAHPVYDGIHHSCESAVLYLLAIHWNPLLVEHIPRHFLQ